MCVYIDTSAALAQAVNSQSASGVATLLDGAKPGTLTVAGITVYGTIDVGLGYQTHGTPLNGFFPQGLEYAISRNSNRSVFSATPGGLGHNVIGLKGNQSLNDLAGPGSFPGWSGVFNLQMGFSPLSGHWPMG